MVKMSMGQENGVQGLGRDRKGSPVPIFKLSFLIKSTINQKPCIISFQKILGAGNIAGGSQKA
jgi:hypothetical protein